MVASNSVKLILYAVLAVVCGGVISGAVTGINIDHDNIVTSDSGSFGSLQRFKSVAELRSFLESHSGGGLYFIENGVFAISGKAATAAQTASSAAKASADGSIDYSGTNIQVAGVEEADQVKTDGKYLYISKGDTVYIVLAYPPEEAKLYSTITPHEQVDDIFISGDKLVVFSREQPNYSFTGGFYPGLMPPMYRSNTVNVKVYDVSDRAQPKLDREFKAEGGYLSSRMIGDYVYLVVQRGAWLVEGKPSLPMIQAGSTKYEVQPSQIYYANGTDPSYAYTMVIGFNAQDPAAPVRSETFLIGSGSTLYVSTGHLFLTVGGYGGTNIHKFVLDEGKAIHVAEGSVPGWVLNQFSMDESGGYFRVATTDGFSSRGASSSSSAVYVLDTDMKVVGKLEDLAPGEQIYSARFMGDRCYLVTFKKVDPLFVIDLKDPTQPRVLGKLKIPGYSNYLHPYDETHVIGLGKETVDAEMGDFAWYQGVKISLFDVSDVNNPREVAKLEVGDRGTDSPALSDHKAFLFSRDRNLLVIPILEAKVDSSSYSGTPPANAYGGFVYQGAYVFQIGTDGISLRGRVTHISDDSLIKSGYWFDSEYAVERSLYIGDDLYTISGRMVKINALSDLAELKAIELK